MSFFDISSIIGDVYFPSLFPVNMYFNRYHEHYRFSIIGLSMYDKFSDKDIMEMTLGINAKIILQTMHDYSSPHSVKQLINGSLKSVRRPYLLQNNFSLISIYYSC